jgi:hypothetical protein
MPKTSKATSRTITFRLSADDRQWLEDTAKANGCEVAQVLRWALEAYRQYVEMHGGDVHLPIDIRKLWTSIDSTHPRRLGARTYRDALNEEPPGEAPGQETA